MKFGTVPPEPATIANLDGLAPLFRGRVEQVLSIMAARGFDAIVRESLRTAERQAWLYGFGRSYDDDRGIVTNAPTARTSWHYYGLAVDIVSQRGGDGAPGAFWRNMVEVSHLGVVGCVSGMDWRRSAGFGADRPHVQWGNGMRMTPSPHAYALRLAGGNALVWKAVGAS